MAGAPPTTARADLAAVILSSTGDGLSVQLAAAAPPLGRGTRLYVERHGGFEVLHREVWPPARTGGAPRVLLARGRASS